jgi:transcriptional regulator with XRE-family HTH domain
MARVALGMGVRELAALAGVSPDTIARLERGEPLRESTLQTIQRCLEAAGVEFTNGDQPGVRLRGPQLGGMPAEDLNASNDE